MPSGLNKVVLIGNVGKDPEFRYTNDEREIAYFSLATTEIRKNKISGEKTEHTEWHRIVVFAEGLTKIVKNYIRKGSKLYIEGTLRSRKWTDPSGNDRYSVEIVMQGQGSVLVMLDNRRSDGAPGPDIGSNANNEVDLDDEIPF